MPDEHAPEHGPEHGPEQGHAHAHVPDAAPTFSQGRGGPSIGAPAGIGEQVLAVPAGVDGLPGVPGADGDVATGDGSTVGTTRWAAVLDQLEARLCAWRAALRGSGEFPGDFWWPADLGPCPASLRGRAQAVLATQRDVEDELTARRAAIGTLLRGIGTTERRLPIPLFVDQRT